MATVAGVAAGQAGQAGRVLAYADLAERVRASAPRLGSVRLVAVDGGAGSGKTTFAARLADALGGAPVLHTDDLLDGWGDLEGSWSRVQTRVLHPLQAGRAARWQRYDWLAGSFGPWQDLPVPGVLVVEGVGSARTRARGHLSLAVWVQAPRTLRVERGLARDGPELLAPFLAWLDDEAAHHAREGTRAAADLVVDGASLLPHDPRTQYVGLAAPRG